MGVLFSVTNHYKLFQEKLNAAICIGGGIFKYPNRILREVSPFPISLIATIALVFISKGVLYFDVSVCLLV